MKVHEAIIEVMRSVPAVPKNDRNNAQNFSFRGIDATLNAVGPALREHGVVVVPTVRSVETKQVNMGRNGTPMNWVSVLVTYTFVGPGGDTLEATVLGESADAGDKAISKAMSVALRTVLLQTLALPTDEPDPDHDTYERSPEPEKKPKTEADIARDDLRTRVVALKLDLGDVAKLYYADTGVMIQNETDAAKIASFAERLEPGK